VAPLAGGGSPRRRLDALTVTEQDSEIFGKCPVLVGSCFCVEVRRGEPRPRPKRQHRSSRPAVGRRDFRSSSLRAAPSDVGVSRQRWHDGARCRLSSRQAHANERSYVSDRRCHLRVHAAGWRTRQLWILRWSGVQVHQDAGQIASSSTQEN
jgi:hypothetical protein